MSEDCHDSDNGRRHPDADDPMYITRTRRPMPPWLRAGDTFAETQSRQQEYIREQDDRFLRSLGIQP